MTIQQYNFKLVRTCGIAFSIIQVLKARQSIKTAIIEYFAFTVGVEGVMTTQVKMTKLQKKNRWLRNISNYQTTAKSNISEHLTVSSIKQLT